MSEQKAKVKKPVVSADEIRRAEIGMLKIFIAKYPEKAKEYLKEIGFKLAQPNNLS